MFNLINADLTIWKCSHYFWSKKDVKEKSTCNSRVHHFFLTFIPYTYYLHPGAARLDGLALASSQGGSQAGGCVLRQTGTWDLGSFVAVLHPGQTDASPSKKKKKKHKLYGSKNSCLHVQLGQIMDKSIKKDQKPNCHFWRARSKNRVLHMPLAHTTTKRLGKPYKAGSWDTPYPHSL